MMLVFCQVLNRLKRTDDAGSEQSAWRPRVVYHYIQSQLIVPDFVVDVSDAWEIKMECSSCF